MELLEENIGINLLDMDLGNNFLAMALKAQQLHKNKLMGILQTKKQKKSSMKWKDETPNGKKIANHMSDKGLI